MPKDFEILKKMLDIGDFISASGHLMKTKTGEKSLLDKKIEIISISRDKNAFISN